MNAICTKKDIYIYKLSKKDGEFSYDSLTTAEFEGNLILVDEKPDVCEIIEQKMMVEKLQDVLKELPDEDVKLIKALYYENQSEREYAAQIGISQVAIHKRKKKILVGLKDML